ncbi:hypothetical protein BKI52_18465 [marine bacterium AO1-C]|nr:hypothetical protein BKI52_18465 [marine bacterium AO1-C]
MKQDVLINFVEIDDKVVNQEQHTGWVSSFKRFLNMVLSQLLQRNPEIDLLTSDGANLEFTAQEKLNDAKLLVTILSPEYIQTTGSREILDQFFTQSTEDSEVKIPASERCFKVIKFPVDYDDQPEVLQPLLSYNLYYLDRETGERQEFEDFFSNNAEKNYWTTLVDLAYDIYYVLQKLENKETVDRENIRLTGIFGEGGEGAGARTVFLAETSQELAVQRTIIKRELQRYGYQVLPNYTLPNDANAIEKSVQEDLERSVISIHLIGREYGENVKGADVSIVDLQNKLASAHSHQAREHNEANAPGSKSFSRLIWLPPSLVEASERQQRFIENLREDAQGLSGAEILQIPLEDFKTTIRKSLIKAPSQVRNRENAPKVNIDKSQIYLIFDKMDTQPALALMEHLQELGFYVITPLLMGTILEVRQQHIDGLKYCDVAIVFTEKADEQWVKVKLKDLMKAPGFGREKPIQAKILFTINEYKSITNEDLMTYNVRRIEHSSVKSFSEELGLQNILDKVMQSNQS